MPFDTAVHGAKRVRSRISLKPQNSTGLAEAGAAAALAAAGRAAGSAEEGAAAASATCGLVNRPYWADF